MLNKKNFASNLFKFSSKSFSSNPPMDFFWRYRELYHKHHNLETFFPRELKNAEDVEKYYNLPKDRLIKLTDPITIEALNHTIFRPAWKIMLGPGKRWRATYALLISKLLKQDWENDQEKFKLVMDIASVIEIMHIGQLVLDDICDGSEVRRDVPCLHIQYTIGTGLNCGVLTFLQPYRKLFELRPEIAQKGAKLYIEGVSNLIIGQSIKEFHSDSVNYNFYKDAEMLTAGSTAKFLLKFLFALHDGEQHVLDKLCNIHDRMFLVHQIKDDIANLLPIQIATSKDLIGEDISVGKYTPLITYSLEHSDKASSEKLYTILKSGTRDQKILDEAIAIIKKAGGFEYAESLMHENYNLVVEDIQALKKEINPNKYNLASLDELWGYTNQLTQLTKTLPEQQK